MREALKAIVFPALTFGAPCAAMVMLDRGISPDHVVMVLSVIVIAAVALLERLLPHDPEYNRPQGDMGADLVYNFTSSIVVPEGFRAVGLGWLAGLAVGLSSWLGASLWPTAWPLVAQVVVALLIAEFGSYWLHRLQHRVDLFWRFHATHHSPKRLYWLNAGRFHILDATVSYFVPVVPLLLMGIPEPTFAVFTVVLVTHAVLQHANIALRVGPLNWIFSTADLHRWHHAPSAVANNNFGTVLILWDVVFGSRHLPQRPPKTVGLEQPHHFPTDVVGQTLAPFRWQRLLDAQIDRDHAAPVPNEN